jgi:hypothetical protein
LWRQVKSYIQAFSQFKDAQALFAALREAFERKKDVGFRGTHQTPEDPLITDKERVQTTIYEIWKVTGYRFRYLRYKNASGIQFLTCFEG